MNGVRIMMVEDAEADFLLVQREISQSRLAAELFWVRDADELSAALEDNAFDLILTDYKVPGLDFSDTLTSIWDRLPDVPVILVSGSVGEETAVELMRKGLNDFVLKDRLFRLVPAIERSLSEQAEKKKRVEIERQLARNDQLMSAVLKGTSDAIFIKDRRGCYLLFNDAAARNVGREAKDVIGRDDTFLFNPATAAKIMEDDRRIMTAGTLRTDEFWLTTHDGKQLAVFVTKGPVYDQDGKVNGIFGISRDITDRKNAERTQQFNLRLLELVHDHTDMQVLLNEFVREIKVFVGCEAVGIRVLDSEGNIPYQAYRGFNRAFFESESPLSIKSDRCMCINVIKGDTDDRRPFYTAAGSFYMNGTTRFLATVSETDKGQTRNVCNMTGYESVALVPFKSEGRILGLIHVADRREDMVPLAVVELLERAMMQLGTAFQRSRARLELRASQELLRSIIDNAQSIIWVKGLDGRFQVVNTFFLNILGRSQEEVIGRTDYDLLPAALAEEGTRNDRQVLESGRPIEVEETAVLADGPHTFLSVKFPLCDGNNKMYAVSAISTDISLLKKTESSLIREEQKYRQLSREYRVLLDNVPDGIIHLSPNLDIRWANATAQRMFGLESGVESPAGTWRASFRQQESGLPNPVVLCLSSGKSETGELSLTDDDRKFELRAVPVIGEAREIDGVIAIIRDITAQQKLEQQLHQAQKMESVGRLAGGVAHDYNNMLSIIIGYAELALAKLDPADTLHGDITEIYDAAVRSTEITRQLLAFARKQTVSPVVFELNEAVEGMLKMLQPLIGEDIDLVWLPKAGLWPVKMDISQLHQILANLCVNARDAINGVGRITIETGMVTFNAAYCADHPGTTPGEYVVLGVDDDGCGMDRDTVSKIFEPFFTTKEVGQGTGLGLATVYGIVKQNNGFINVYSEPGKGAAFRIYLARHTDVPVEISTAAPPRIPGGHGQVILVVEDEASILKYARRLLDKLGYTVLTASSPDQALDLVEHDGRQIDLLLTDVVMPGMNGKELSNIISKMYPGLKTLFMSGYTADAIAHRGVLDVGIDFIQKPFSREDMARKIHEVLRQ